MFRRLLLISGAFATFSTMALAQPAPERIIPDGCRKMSPTTLDLLTKRKEALELAIARKQGKAPPPTTQGGDAFDITSLRTNQEDLLETLFNIECLKAGFVPPSPPPLPPAMRKVRGVGPAPRAPAQTTTSDAAQSSEKKLVEVTTYYATNRLQTANSDPMQRYNNERGALQFGKAVVTIPPTHKEGQTEAPSLWYLELRRDQERHFTLKDVKSMPANEMSSEIAARLATATSKSLLLFVHGYNNSFADAAFRTAQMAYDMKFQGIPFFYSWPSQNAVRGYFQDEETARLCEEVFSQLVDELNKLPVSEIYVVAHSMGNRIVGHGLEKRIAAGKNNAKVRGLLLAAPDISADIFKEQIAPKLAALQGARTTIYAASNDFALKGSATMHGYTRVGETGTGVFVYPGLDTVDASSASGSTGSLGHSYVVESEVVLRDIQKAIGNIPAAKRGLKPEGKAPNSWWKL